MLGDFRELQDAHAQLKESMDNRIQGYDAALETRTSDIAALKEQMSGYEDYETIQGELKVLKNMEFGSDRESASINFDQYLPTFSHN